MSILTNREWNSWIRISILVVVIHTIILGLLNDWMIFLLHENSIMLFENSKSVAFELPQYVRFEHYYPKVFDGLIIPVFSLIFIFLLWEVENRDWVIGCLIGFLLGFAILWNYDVGVNFRLIDAFVAILIAGFIFRLGFGSGAGIGTALGAGFFIGFDAGFGIGLAVLIAGFTLELAVGFGIFIKNRFVIFAGVKIINWFLVK